MLMLFSFNYKWFIYLSFFVVFIKQFTEKINLKIIVFKVLLKVFDKFENLRIV